MSCENFTIWVDGFGKLGEGENATLPTMKIVSEDYRGGGMDIPVKVDLGMEPLSFEFKLSSFDPQAMSQFGQFPGQEKQFTVRGSLAHQDGSAFPTIAGMRGNMHRVESDEFTPGGKPMHTFGVELTYYKLTIGEQLIYEIDPENARRIINGVDQLRTDRINLGLSI